MTEHDLEMVRVRLAGLGRTFHAGNRELEDRRYRRNTDRDAEPVLRRFALRAVREPELARDLVQETKLAIRRGLALDPVTAARAEAVVQAHSIGMDDAREGIAALLEKRAPKFTGR